MMSQLVMLVIGAVILFDDSTAQSDYPCYAADCVPGKFCRVAERRCVIMPCAPQVRCTDNLPANRVCREGFPLLEMLVDKEIECSKTRLCPSYTECIKGRCCWIGFPSDKPVSTVRPDKAGDCPGVTGVIGTCVERCSGDYNCTGSKKCCSNGCGRTCTNPVSKTSTRPGTCPTLASGICSSVTRMCTNDNDCPSAQKCCTTSCGRTCQNTLESSARQGTCPKPSSVGSCVNRCDFDSNCPKGEKCCKNGCGRSCMTTMEKRSPRPGQCPALRISSTCFKECSYDSDCSGTMKCCRNGCGALCTSAAQSTISTCPREKNALIFCYISSRCMKDTDCGIDETCCLSKTCSRICIFKPMPMSVMPVVSYAGTIFNGGK